MNKQAVMEKIAQVVESLHPGVIVRVKKSK
jgi:hypothetical protein